MRRKSPNPDEDGSGLRHLPDILNDCARATVLRRHGALLAVVPPGGPGSLETECRLGIATAPRRCRRCTRDCRARGAPGVSSSACCAEGADPEFVSAAHQQQRSSDHASRECPLLMPTLPSGCTLPFTLHGAGRKKKVTCFTIPSCLSARRIEKALLRFVLVFWSHSRCTCK